MILPHTKKAVPSGMAFVFVLLLTGLLLLFSGCSEQRQAQEDESDQPANLRFRVDEDLVAPAEDVSELGVSIRPPMDWQLQDVPVQEDLPIDVLRLFVGEGPSYLLIGVLQSQDSAEEIAPSLMASDDDELTSFVHNDILFHQIRRVSPEHVSFSVLFDTPTHDAGGPGILQFVIPTAYVEEKARMVESSLGSLETLSSEL
jgi:antitoxin component of RelBE/YafQ-DinJ toxin-antitoxin module